MSEGKTESAIQYPHGCPLPDSILCNGINVFIICREVSSTDGGFKSKHEKNEPLNGNRKGIVKPESVCMSMGLSVFKSLNDCIHHKKNFPRFGDKIASAKLTEEHGRIKKTGINPGHHTWWSIDSESRWKIFKVVEYVESSENT